LTICLCHILADPSKEVKRASGYRDDSLCMVNGDASDVRSAPSMVNDADSSGQEVPVQTVTGRSPSSSTQKIHGDYHGHLYPYDYVTEHFTWDNTFCPSCRWTLAQAHSHAKILGKERTQILVHWNHLIFVSKRRVSTDDYWDEDYSLND